MGHSHFFLPTALYNEKIRPLPVGSKHIVYETMMAEPSLKVLYHTAEQLTTVPTHEGKPVYGGVTDPVLLWRYFTRNIIGDNSGDPKLEVHRNEGPRYNTVHELEGHESWSAGFSISASQDGCFPYRDGNTIRYFDLSLQDL